MCRNIRTLFNLDPPATEDEVRAASLQFVRKISGCHKPSQANEAVFREAVHEVAEVSLRLLRDLQTARARRTGPRRPERQERARPAASGREEMNAGAASGKNSGCTAGASRC